MGLLFAHHKKFEGFSKMEVGCVTGILIGLLIIRNFGFFFPRNGSHDLSATLLIFQCNTDISVIYRRYCSIFFDFLLSQLSMPDIMSGLTDNRNIDDISLIYRDILNPNYQ